MPTVSVSEELAQKLAKLKGTSGDQGAAADVHELAEELLAEVSSSDLAGASELMGELNGLLSTIRNAKSELAALAPEEVKEAFIPQATDELDAIIEATAEATNTIMDAAEKIEEAGSSFAEKIAGGGDVKSLTGELQTAQSDAVMQIFEACTFQDITGQRITRVISVFKDIEEKIDELVEAFGGELSPGDPSAKVAKKATKVTKRREDLLNGPQLPGQGSSQDDVDALLAEFDKK